MTTAVQKYTTTVQKLAAQSLEAWLGRESAIEAAGRLSHALRAAAAANPNIYECPPADLAIAVAMCARTGLMPGGVAPDVYLIPRKNYGQLHLNWQISARGLRKLAEREGWILRARLVFDGDRFEAAYGFDDVLVHEPDWSKEPSWDRLTHAYVTAEHRQTGERAFTVLHKAQIQARRNTAQSDKVWAQWPLEMAEKTAIAYAVRRGLVPFEETAKVVGDEMDAHVVEAQPVTASRPTAPSLPQPAPQFAEQLPTEDLFFEPSAADKLAAEIASVEVDLVDMAPPVDHAAIALEALRERVTATEGQVKPSSIHGARDRAGIGRRTSLKRLGAEKLQAYEMELGKLAGGEE